MKAYKISAVLLFSVTLLLFASCGADTAADPAAATAAVTKPEIETTPAETKEVRPELPTSDYNGYEFRVVKYDIEKQQWTGLINDILVESENGDVLNDAVYRRNLLVQEKYNFSISDKAVADISSVLRQMVLAGTYDYDAVFQETLDFGKLLLGGYLTDLYDLPLIDWDYPWWDHASAEGLEIKGKLFGIFSDITLIDKYSTYIAMFHKGMAESYGLPDLYQTVADGQWTIDKMTELSRDVSKDLNGDGVYDRHDVYGIACQNDGLYILMHGCGAKFAEPDADGIPTDIFGKEKTITTVQKIVSIITDPQLYFNRQTYSMTVPECIEMFANNQALFFIRPLQTVEVLRSMENDYGIIPIPKYAEEDEEYRCTINKWTACIMCIPLLVEDPARTATILEELAAESHYTVMPAYYKTVLGEKIVRDEESAEMLDLIFVSRMYDIGYLYDFGSFCNTLLTTIPKSNDANIASLYAANQTVIQKAIDEFIAAIG